jgi:hypothetical protein
MLDGLISINGILQSDGSHYITNDDSLIFSEAPVTGSRIVIQYHNGLTRYFEGNGSQHIFPMGGHTEIMKFDRLMRDITKHKDNPAVKDLLEQLQIVTELLR